MSTFIAVTATAQPFSTATPNTAGVFMNTSGGVAVGKRMSAAYTPNLFSGTGTGVAQAPLHVRVGENGNASADVLMMRLDHTANGIPAAWDPQWAIFGGTGLKFDYKTPTGTSFTRLFDLNDTRLLLSSNLDIRNAASNQTFSVTRALSGTPAFPGNVFVGASNNSVGLNVFGDLRLNKGTQGWSNIAVGQTRIEMYDQSFNGRKGNINLITDASAGGNGRLSLVTYNGTTWLNNLSVLKNGKVYIGTDENRITPLEASTTNDYRLYVEKGIRTEEVQVDTKSLWADYVFAPDYNLRPLAEVKAFIAEHQHLPEIPSAKEVAEKGLSVGDMMAKQMAKIEELTLYLLQQQEQIAKLQAELAELKKN